MLQQQYSNQDYCFSGLSNTYHCQLYDYFWCITCTVVRSYLLCFCCLSHVIACFSAALVTYCFPADSGNYITLTFQTTAWSLEMLVTLFFTDTGTVLLAQVSKTKLVRTISHEIRMFQHNQKGKIRTFVLRRSSVICHQVFVNVCQAWYSGNGLNNNFLDNF